MAVWTVLSAGNGPEQEQRFDAPLLQLGAVPADAGNHGPSCHALIVQQVKMGHQGFSALLCYIIPLQDADRDAVRFAFNCSML